MTVWLTSLTVKINPAQGDLHPDAGLDLDASVTSRDGLCAAGPSRGLGAEERPRCAKTPPRRGFLAPVCLGPEERSSSARWGVSARRRSGAVALLWALEAIASGAAEAPKVTFGGAR